MLKHDSVLSGSFSDGLTNNVNVCQSGICEVGSSSTTPANVN